MRKGIILIYVVILIGLIYIVKSLTQPANRQVVTTAVAVNISSSFNLVDSSAKPVSSSDFLGKIMLVYFGFTYCPDICPAELSKLSKVIEQLGDNKDHVQAIFITIDPARDNLAQLKSYMQHFDKNILALGGSEEQIAEAANNYRVYRNKLDSSNQNYMIDHSSLIYLIDQNGKYLTSFNIKTSHEDIVKYLETLIRG